MTTEVIEQERVKKKEVAAGAGALILLVLLALAFAKKEEEPPEGQPSVKIEGMGFQSSPQVSKITKEQGQSFTPYLELNNTGAAGTIYIKSRFGWKTFYGFDEEGTMPILDQSLSVTTGRKTYQLPSKTLRSDAKISVYDVYVGLSLHSGGVDMDYKVFEDVFTVIAKGTPTVSVLSLSWL